MYCIHDGNIAGILFQGWCVSDKSEGVSDISDVFTEDSEWVACLNMMPAQGSSGVEISHESLWRDDYLPEWASNPPHHHIGRVLTGTSLKDWMEEKDELCSYVHLNLCMSIKPVCSVTFLVTDQAADVTL